MKKLLVLIILINITLSIFGQERVTGDTKPRLGILPFTGGVGGDGETIATLFSFQNEIRDAFTVVPRTSAVNALIAEQNFQMTGYTDSDTIARLGRLLNADFVVSGHIRRLGNRNLVITTIVNVETFEQLAGDYREYQGEIEEVQGLLPDIVRIVINASRRDTSALPNLAIVPFHIASDGVNVHDAETLAQILSIELGNSGRYTVLPRTTAIQAALEELQFQMTGATAEEEAKALGRAINASYVLNAEIRSLGTTNIFTASILNVEDGSLLIGGYRNYRVVTDGITLMAELASELTGGTSVLVQLPARETTVGQRPPRERQEPSLRFNSIGLSLGSSFATPAVIGTVQGTFSLTDNMFFELGLDIGLVYIGEQGDDFSVDGYYSLFPYVNLGSFLPFAKKAGWYIGAGGGYMFAEYTFSDGSVAINAFAINITTGILIGDFLNISYTLRTNFEGASNKVAVGYSYKFK